MAKRLQMAKIRKRHLVRSLLTDVEPAGRYGAHVIFHCADDDFVLELQRGTAEQLRDQLSRLLSQGAPRARLRSSDPSATSRNK